MRVMEASGFAIVPVLMKTPASVSPESGDAEESPPELPWNWNYSRVVENRVIAQIEIAQQPLPEVTVA